MSDADTRPEPGAFGQQEIEPRLFRRRPFPPPELVRAGAVAICSRDLTLGPRRIHGDNVPAPSR